MQPRCKRQHEIVREVFSVETYTFGGHSVDVHGGEVEPGSSSDVEEMSSDELDDDAPEPPLHSNGELAQAQADGPFGRRLRRYMELAEGGWASVA